MNIKVLLKHNVEQIVNYLEEHLPLANVHMVDYFTKNVYETYIPQNIQKEIKKIGFKNTVDRILKNDYTDLPYLNLYANKSKQFTLKNLDICLKDRTLEEKLVSLGCSEVVRFKLNIFMTSKKSHEVDILSGIAAALKSISRTTHLIDIGDGKGYLSSMLALHHKIPVLGVDASEINTNGAVTRVKKLSRVWNSEISKKLNTSCPPLLPNKIEDIDTKTTSENMYKQVTKYVDDKIDFLSLVSNVFLETPNGLGLVGLHTCGNLASTCLKIFSTNENIKTICNVGCCYHFITEAFEEEFNVNLKEQQLVGFPMSEFLKAKKFKIGKRARMIAAQSMERILEKKELPNKTIFYRALLEVLLEIEFKNLQSDKKLVGRFRKKAHNFTDYAKKALKRLNLNVNVTDDDFEKLLNDYKDREYELYVFFLIRNMLSPIIEALILLDRLLYLHELDFENSFLVQFFDPVVSPRCYGIVALK